MMLGLASQWGQYREKRFLGERDGLFRIGEILNYRPITSDPALPERNRHHRLPVSIGHRSGCRECSAGLVSQCDTEAVSGELCLARDTELNIDQGYFSLIQGVFGKMHGRMF